MRRRSGQGGPPATPVAVGGSEKTATPLSVAVTARRKDSGLHAGEPPSPVPAPQLSARGSPSPAPDDHLEQNELAMDDNREGDAGKQQVEKFRSLVIKNDVVELECTGKKTIPSKALMEGVLSMLGGCVEFFPDHAKTGKGTIKKGVKPAVLCAVLVAKMDSPGFADELKSARAQRKQTRQVRAWTPVGEDAAASTARQIHRSASRKPHQATPQRNLAKKTAQTAAADFKNTGWHQVQAGRPSDNEKLTIMQLQRPPPRARRRQRSDM